MKLTIIQYKALVWNHQYLYMNQIYSSVLILFFPIVHCTWITALHIRARFALACPNEEHKIYLVGLH